MKVARGVRLRERGHRRDALPGRRVLVPRDEHPPAGRALRHRDGHPARPRRRAAPRRRRASRCRSPQDSVVRRGHSIECRINAEDPAKGFLPSPGTITRLRLPGGPGVRWDGGYDEGDTVSQYYDNLIGKLVVWAPDRDAARARMLRALGEFEISGVHTTIPAHRRAARRTPTSRPVAHSTKWVEDEVDAVAVRRRARAAASPRTAAERRRPSRSSSGRCPVEVDGKRFSVKLWLPEAPAARRGAGGAASRPPEADGARRRRRAAGSGTISAPMQGTIVKVLVARGRHGRDRSVRARARGDEDGEPHQRRERRARCRRSGCARATPSAPATCSSSSSERRRCSAAPAASTRSPSEPFRGQPGRGVPARRAARRRAWMQAVAGRDEPVRDRVRRGRAPTAGRARPALVHPDGRGRPVRARDARIGARAVGDGAGSAPTAPPGSTPRSGALHRDAAPGDTIELDFPARARAARDGRPGLDGARRTRTGSDLRNGARPRRRGRRRSRRARDRARLPEPRARSPIEPCGRDRARRTGPRRATSSRAASRPRVRHRRGPGDRLRPLRARPFWAERLGRDELVGHQVSTRGGVVPRGRAGRAGHASAASAVTVLRGDLLA